MKRWILPLRIFGSAVTNSISRGYVVGAPSAHLLVSRAFRAIHAGLQRDDIFSIPSFSSFHQRK